MHKTAKRSAALLAISLTFMLVLFGCSEKSSPVQDQQIDQAELSVYQGALAKGDIGLANELRLKYFAKAMAKSLTIPGVGAFLKEEIGKKFDGDYDALWETVKDREFPNQGRLRGLVASALQDMNSIVAMDEIEEVPLLQVALPVGFEAWDGETPIVVAYTPLTVNDVDVEEIYAYDSSGEEHVLDGQVPPDFPVMVVGINERVSANGDVFFSNVTGSDPTYAINSLPPDDPPPPPPPPPPVNEGIYIHKIYVKRPIDLEPWWMGDLEMVVRKYDGYCYVNADVPNDDTPCDGEWIDGWFTVLGGRVDVQFTTTQESVHIQVFEDDAVGGNDYVIVEGTLSYPGWSISDIDEGDHYMCGDYIRCAYWWLWGTDGGTADCTH